MQVPEGAQWRARLATSTWKAARPSHRPSSSFVGRPAGGASDPGALPPAPAADPGALPNHRHHRQNTGEGALEGRGDPGEAGGERKGDFVEGKTREERSVMTKETDYMSEK